MSTPWVYLGQVRDIEREVNYPTKLENNFPHILVVMYAYLNLKSLKKSM